MTPIPSCSEHEGNRRGARNRRGAAGGQELMRAHEGGSKEVRRGRVPVVQGLYLAPRRRQKGRIKTRFTTPELPGTNNLNSPQLHHCKGLVPRTTTTVLHTDDAPRPRCLKHHSLTPFFRRVVVKSLPPMPAILLLSALDVCACGLAQFWL